MTNQQTTLEPEPFDYMCVWEGMLDRRERIRAAKLKSDADTLYMSVWSAHGTAGTRVA